MGFREPVGDSELAANRLRALELVPSFVEPAQARIEVRAAEQRVRLDRRQIVIATPGQLLVEEREHFRYRRAARPIAPPTSFQASI